MTVAVEAHANQPSRVRTGLSVLGSDPVVLVVLIAAPALIRLWFAATLPLTEDEAYYRLWALAPAMSYYDHPPMVGWLMAAGRWIAGDTALGLRLPAIIATAISTLALWRIAGLLIGRDLARLAALFAVTIPLLNVGAILMTPDTPSVLFVVLGAWALAELNASRHETSHHANWWLAVGLFAGLGLLSKYTNFFFGVTILVWLAALRSNWHGFRNWQLYAGGAIALAMFAPVILWNLAHDGASFSKQFGRVVDVGATKAIWQLELWGALILLVGPVLAGLAVLGLIETARRYWRDNEPEACLLLALTLPLLIYFALHALHGRVLPNWLAPIYPFVAILAALGVQQIRKPTARRIASGAGARISAALTLLIHAHALQPVYLSSKTKDPTHQLRGWPELTAEIAKTVENVGAAYIATTSYGTTGQLAFYLDKNWRVFQLNERIRYGHLPEPDPSLRTTSGLVVELARRKSQAKLAQHFAKVEPLGTLTRSHHGTPVETYELFRISEPVRALTF